jgi:tetratricopeptide (TPR) repeat protein
MGIKIQIRNLLREAELYRAQGLYSESKSRYQNALTIISNASGINNQDALIDRVQGKINLISERLGEMDDGADTPQMSTHDQKLVKKLFTYSPDNDEDAAALEGATALAKFGQYGQALKEFGSLLQRESVRVNAAKNMFRCYFALSQLDQAVEQYNRWLSDDLFTAMQLENIRLFLDDNLQRRGYDQKLSKPQKSQIEAFNESATLSQAAPESEDFIDISSIVLNIESGDGAKTKLELEVSFQTGNLLSTIVSKNHKTIMLALKPGQRIESVEFFSPIAIFEGSAIVQGKNEIGAGPKKGDYGLDLKIIQN